MAVTIGLDFGTRTTQVYVRDKGIILREPTVAAVDTQGNVIAVGTEALLIRGRSPGTVTLRHPIKDNTICDFNLAAEMLDRFLEIAAPRARKHVFAAAKNGFGSRNREMLCAALRDCRTGHITLVEAGKASLCGSGIDVTDSAGGGTIVCDIGAGSSEAAYIRNGELLRADTISDGGDAADSAVIAYIRRKYGLAITSVTAREAKHLVSLTDEPAETVLRGLDGSTGMPRRIRISTDELIRPIAPQIHGAVDAIRASMSNLPRHGINESVVDRILLVGGGAALSGIAAAVSDVLEREVLTVEQPACCTVRGIGTMIENKWL